MCSKFHIDRTTTSSSTIFMVRMKRRKDKGTDERMNRQTNEHDERKNERTNE